MLTWRFPEMNINVFSRLVPAAQYSQGFCPNRLPCTYNERVDTKDIYSKELARDVELFYNGMNVSFVVMGDHLSSKFTTVFGSHGSRDGVLPLFIDRLFCCGNKRKTFFEEKVTLSWFEVNDHEVIDVLNDRNTCHLVETPEEGITVSNLSNICIPNAQSMTGIIQRNVSSVDKDRISFVEVTLEKPRLKGTLATKSKFTIILLPVLLTFCDNIRSGLFHQTDDSLQQSLSSFGRAVSSLADVHCPNSFLNYEGSKLMMLMRDILGGNSKTSVLICLKPSSNPSVNALLKDLAGSLSKIKNFPIINTEFARKLLYQFREQILSMKESDWICGQQTSDRPLTKPCHSFPCNVFCSPKHNNNNTLGSNSSHDNILERCQSKCHKCKVDLHPCKHNNSNTLGSNLSHDNILERLGAEQCRTKCHNCKADLRPCRIPPQNPCCLDVDYFTEETRNILCQDVEPSGKICMDPKDTEKLSMMDMVSNLRFENEKLCEERGDIRHQHYVDKKQLECRMKSLEQEVERNSALLNMEKQKNFVLERDWEEISRKLEEVTSRHEELTRVFKAQVERLEQQKSELQNIIDFPCTNATSISGRLRELVDEMSHILCDASSQLSNIKEESLKCAPSCPTKCFDGGSTVPITTHEKIQRNLQDHINSLNQELIGSKQTNRDLEKRISKFTSRIHMLDKEKFYKELEIKQLQGHLKEVNQKFKMKILCYVNEKFGCRSSYPNGLQVALDDMKSCYLEREKQLSGMASAYKERYQEIMSKHERLLAAYKDIYTQVKQNNWADLVDLGLIEEYLKLPGSTDSCSSLHQDYEDPELWDNSDSGKQKLLSMNASVRREIEDIQRRINRGLAKIQSEKKPCSSPPTKSRRNRKVVFQNDLPCHDFVQNELPDFPQGREPCSPPKFKPFKERKGDSCLASIFDECN